MVERIRMLIPNLIRIKKLVLRKAFIDKTNLGMHEIIIHL